MQRRKAEPPFAVEAQRRILEFWRPFADAASLSHEFGGARARGIADGLESAQRAAIPFDGASRVLAMNGLAEALVGELFHISSRSLTFIHRPSQSNVLARLAHAIEGEQAREPNSLAGVALNRRGQQMSVRAIGLGGFAEFGFANARALLLIGDRGNERDGSHAVALSRYGLTAAEARVAQEIA